jgi:hypothetical protein
VLRKNLIALSALKKNSLMIHLQLLEKQEQVNPKTSRTKEVIKIRAKINEMETKKYKELIKLKLASLKRYIRLINP